MRLLILVTIILSIVAIWRIGKMRDDNTYNRYQRAVLAAIAFNNFMTFWAMSDMRGVNLPVAYIVKRIVGLSVQALFICALCLFLLGVINGVGWFSKKSDDRNPTKEEHTNVTSNHN